MENGSIDVSVNDTLSKKIHTIQLTPSRTVNSIFKEISKKYDYNIDDINLVLESGPTGQSFCVSKTLFTTFNLKHIILNNQKIAIAICLHHYTESHFSRVIWKLLKLGKNEVELFNCKNCSNNVN